MSVRFMRVMVFFDLPVDTAEDRKNYSRFRKFLLKEGFIMLQYSVYTKLAVNKTVAAQVFDRIEKNKPSAGSVAVLNITENQFAGISWIVGSKQTKVLDTVEKIVFYDEV